MTAKPAKPHQEHLLIIEDGKGRNEVILKDPAYSVGRDQKCEICLRSQFVSRRHATLFRKLREDGSAYYQIVDGDAKGKQSVNGLMINGRKMSEHDLKHGDEIVFGPQVFAIYQLRQRDAFPTTPPDDPFDITLIDPAMMIGDPED
ncbi:MAG: FHA domain-containing protein [Oscillatoria sp. PMC 1051.18]|uniref:FHA domain-containing protein n=1 Tax=Oscillatoria salina TaxID=331517 RepID=UPI0013B97202|nr:FHA domain-containing protein [Oscillatoria salina]MBZ8180136.1 FHA domain-containing protein [Oscillatoria salina IIICB1]MEC4892675.1 FHA domain-containing protein [Oscillatoria sp. PMC 1050.18]MEC5029151.1 FHA domain-containing protein [Oscillatoria sp. PMC 1051.18]NET90979.1 FHA domain-containing protein [Kamptonema sp. SIO1D9]